MSHLDGRWRRQSLVYFGNRKTHPRMSRAVPSGEEYLAQGADVPGIILLTLSRRIFEFPSMLITVIAACKRPRYWSCGGRGLRNAIEATAGKYDNV